MPETIKMMVVDDDPNTCRIMTKWLSRYGLPDITNDAERAIELWKQATEAGTPYDIIFLDLMLPGVGGHVAAREIRKIEKEMFGKRVTRIVIASGLKNTTQTFANVLDLCDSYIGKPVKHESVLTLLDKFALTPDTPVYENPDND